MYILSEMFISRLMSTSWLFTDRYVFCCSYSHNVAPKGKFIAFVSTDAETDNPQTELKPGIDLLGPVDELFFDIYDRYEPVNEPTLDNCFISTVSLVMPSFVSILKLAGEFLTTLVPVLNRVMMLQHTLTQLLLMCWTCINWSPER